ncbi:MAG: tRNA pseudouridine(38-40) synthase TruA [Saprospiraceae bacterium]|nr:tRNA pseudouridine(38-40) synthase TruA [Saprospiraceae bacterium]
MRYFLELKYDGTSFHGWQKLKHFPSVQETLENSLSIILRRTITCHGCGRTDAGVHALKYFAHLDLQPDEEINLLYQTNKILPSSILILDIKPVSDKAHSQRDAMQRKYRYHLHLQKNPFISQSSYWYPFSISLEMLQVLATLLIGTHDFRAFTKTPARQAHTNCTIFNAGWAINSEGQHVFDITGDHFARGMVRILVANMLEVSAGRLTMDIFRHGIQHQKKMPHFNMAPPEGLFLVDVTY